MLFKALKVTMLLLILLDGAMTIWPPEASHPRVQPVGPNLDWGQATFQGLVLGKSNAVDVIRAFGSPSSSGGVEKLLLPSDREGEIRYEYPTLHGGDGRLQIVLGRSGGVVNAILFYPTKMTHADMTAKFGSDFEESNVKLGACPTAEEKKLTARRQEQYRALLVYRKLGLCVLVNPDNGDVFAIEYLARCR